MRNLGRDDFGDPSQFLCSLQVDAISKSRTARSLVGFFSRGLQSDQYTPHLHRMLSPLFGLPAESISQFKDRWLADADGKRSLLTHLAHHTPLGDPMYSMVDVERAVRNWVIWNLLESWARTARRAEATREREQLLALLKVHGVPEDFKLPGI